MNKNIIIALVIIVIIAAGAFYYFSKPIAPVVVTPIVAPAQQQPAVVSTVVPAAIVSAVLSDNIAADGSAINPANNFTQTTKNIYAVISLSNATKSAKLAYIRKYNGKYVDSKVSHPSKDGIKNFHFEWSLAVGQTRKAGNYSLTFYINGKRAQQIDYVIK